MTPATEEMLRRVVGYAAEHGIAGKSLREIAAGVGTSHRMLIYHFGSHEGLLTAIVREIERQQREFMTEVASGSRSQREATTLVWEQVSSARMRPFVRLFFEVFGLAVQGGIRTQSLTDSWIETARSLDADPTLVRLGVAVSRGLLLDLVAGADPAEVRAAHDLFADLLISGKTG